MKSAADARRDLNFIKTHSERGICSADLHLSLSRSFCPLVARGLYMAHAHDHCVRER